MYIDEQAIINIILKSSSEQDLDLTNANFDENISNFGIDSIGFIMLIINLEDEFGCEIPDNKLIFTEMDSINKIMFVMNSILKNSTGEQNETE